MTPVTTAFRRAVCGRVSAALVAWAFAGAAAAATVTLDSDLRGTYASDGSPSLLTSTGGYFAGYHAQTGLTYNNWFSFDLSGMSDVVVTGAQLVLSAADYYSSDASETYQLYQVTTSFALFGSVSTSIYQDLGSGPEYGSATLTVADAHQTIVIDLGANALADLNSALGGSFVLGGGLTSLELGGLSEGLFGNSTGATNLSRLVLTTAPVPVPIPASALLLASGLAGLGAWRRRSRC
jgi:hypothetical protein